jgi:predicted RNA-binding protein with PUA-like domain
MSLKQINELILTSELTDADINSIVESIKYVRSRNARLNLRTLRVGDAVQFTSSRSNQTVRGTVKKIAIKNIVIDTPQGAWRVPANMVEMA